MLSVFIAAVATSVLARRYWTWKRRPAEVSKDIAGRYFQEALVGPNGSLLAWLPEEKGALVLATLVFTPPEPAELLEQGHAWLALNEGDIVQVEACGAEWIYGHLATETNRVGFFPATCAAWLGRPLQDALHAETLGRAAQGLPDWSPPGSPVYVDQHLRLQTVAASTLADRNEELEVMPGPRQHSSTLATSSIVESADTQRVLSPSGPTVQINLAFNAAEVFGTSLPPEQCLPLQGGEAVEVIGAGAGWLYGRLVQDPERMGYFPEDRATWTQDLRHHAVSPSPAAENEAQQL